MSVARGYGYSYLQVPQEEFQKIYNSINDDWKLDNHGKKFKSKPIHNFHSTFVGKIPNEVQQEATSKLSTYLCENVLPFKGTVQEYMISKVERIKDKKIFCLVASVCVEKACNAQISFVEARRMAAKLTGGTIHYNEEQAHISIAYFEEKYVEEVQKLLPQLPKFDFLISSMAIMFKTETISMPLKGVSNN